MKNYAIALGTLIAYGFASAQSTVSIFGVVDMAYQQVWNNAGPDSRRLVSGSNLGSRIGFRGSEDLGGGLAAGFWLEAGVSTDVGAGQATNTNNQTPGTTVTGVSGLTFNRRSTVSLSGLWGELRLGRDVGVWALTSAKFDPFVNFGLGIAQFIIAHGGLQAPGQTLAGVPNARVSNTIAYWTPANMGGFNGQVMYYLGENASNSPLKGDGSGYGARLGYTSGPFQSEGAYSRFKYATGDVKFLNIGSKWNFGFATAMVNFERDEFGTSTNRGWLVGATVPMGSGAGEVRMSYSEYRTEAAGPDPRTGRYAVGYVHNLSRRTALYSTAAVVRNSNGARGSVSVGSPAVNSRSSGIELGIRHAF